MNICETLRVIGSLVHRGRMLARTEREVAVAGRHTNLALFGLLALAIITGGLAFALGTGWGRAAVIAHGAGGLAMVALVPWKQAVVRRGLGKPAAGRLMSVALGVLVATTVVSGFLFSTGLVLRYGPLNAIQVHVGSALLSVPLAVQHVRARPVTLRRADLDRRNLLRTGALIGAGGLAWGMIEGAMRLFSWQGADRRFTGSHERGSFEPAAMPTTQWLDDSTQRIDGEDWVLIVAAGDASREWTQADLGAFDDRLRATLDCTSGWYATQDWSGVRLDRVLDGVDGGSFEVVSASGYSRRFRRPDAARFLLATAVGGEPLSAGHGFPARLVAPGRRGFWWVKWVVRITVDDRPWWLQPPYPLT